MKKMLLSIAFLLNASPLFAGDGVSSNSDDNLPTSDQFQYIAPIEVKDKKQFYEFELPEEVLQKLSHNYEDLRVINNKGEVIPYNFSEKSLETLTTRETIKLKLFPIPSAWSGSYDKNLNVILQKPWRPNKEQIKKNEIAGYLISVPENKGRIDSLTFSWNQDSVNFIAKAEIAASSDLDNWTIIDSNFILASLKHEKNYLIRSQLPISLPPNTKYLRLIWKQANKATILSSVTAEAVKTFSTLPSSYKTLRMKFSPDSNDNLIAHYDGHLPVRWVNVLLPKNSILEATLQSSNDQKDWMSASPKKWYYNLTQDEEQVISEGHFIFEQKNNYWKILPHSPLTDEIKNNSELEAKYRPIGIIFFAQGGSENYKLVYGHPQAKDKTSKLSILDTLFDKNEMGKAQLGKISVQNEKPILNIDPTQVRNQKRIYLFWGIIGVGIILLATISWNLMKELKKKAE